MGKGRERGGGEEGRPKEVESGERESPLAGLFTARVTFLAPCTATSLTEALNRRTEAETATVDALATMRSSPSAALICTAPSKGPGSQTEIWQQREKREREKKKMRACVCVC